MKLKHLKNVVNLKLDTEKCIGCGMCFDVCPHGVFKLENKRAIIYDIESCMECGACKQNCLVEAIDVDVGVGCAYAIIQGIIKNTDPTCDCAGSNDSCC